MVAIFWRQRLVINQKEKGHSFTETAKAIARNLNVIRSKAIASNSFSKRSTWRNSNKTLGSAHINTESDLSRRWSMWRGKTTQAVDGIGGRGPLMLISKNGLLPYFTGDQRQAAVTSTPLNNFIFFCIY